MFFYLLLFLFSRHDNLKFYNYAFYNYCPNCFVADVVWSSPHYKNIDSSKIEDIVANVLKHAKQRKIRQLLNFNSALMPNIVDGNESDDEFEL